MLGWYNGVNDMNMKSKMILFHGHSNYAEPLVHGKGTGFMGDPEKGHKLVRVLKGIGLVLAFFLTSQIFFDQNYGIENSSPNVVYADADKVFGNGPAIEDPKAVKVDYPAQVTWAWDLKGQSGSQYDNGDQSVATIGNLGNLDGKNYVNTIVQVNARVKEHDVFSGYDDLITLPNGKSYWVNELVIKKLATVGNGPAFEDPTATKVNYQVKITGDWFLKGQSGSQYDNGDMSVPTIAMLSDLDGKNYVGTMAQVSERVKENLPFGGGYDSLITLSNGKSYWVNDTALEKVTPSDQYKVLSVTKYAADTSDITSDRDFRADGSRFYTIKPTTDSYPLYADTFGSSNVVGQSSDLVGTYYLASEEEKVQAPDGTQTTAVHISNDNKTWYWVDKRALSTGSDGYKTAYEGMIGDGPNGAIKYWVSPDDPLASEIKAAADKWNAKIPNLFVESDSPTDVNLNFEEKNLQNDGVWASTYFKIYQNNVTKAYSFGNEATVALNTGGSSSLLVNKEKDDQGTVNIIEHELGHVLGLGHSGADGASWSFYTSPTNLMYTTTDGTSNDYNSLPDTMVNVIKFIRSLGWTYVGQPNAGEASSSANLTVKWVGIP